MKKISSTAQNKKVMYVKRRYRASVIHEILFYPVSLPRDAL